MTRNGGEPVHNTFWWKKNLKCFSLQKGQIKGGKKRKNLDFV